MSDEPELSDSSPLGPFSLPPTAGAFRPEIYPIADWGRFWFELSLTNTWPSHRHPEFQGALILNGRGELSLPAQLTCPIRGDCVMFFPAGTMHAIRLRSSAFVAAFNLDAGRAGEIAGERIVSGSVCPLLDYVVHKPLIGELCRELRQERQAGPVGCPTHISFLGSLLCTSLLHAHRRPPVRREPRLLPEVEARVKEHMAKDLRADLSGRALAAIARLSPDHFRRRFAATTGLTPDEYVLRLRLTHARLLLGAGAHNVSQVLELCGFTDHSLFTRQFRRRHGNPPRHYLGCDIIQSESSRL